MSEHTLSDAAPTVNAKVCRGCGDPKPESEFYPRQRKCKACVCAAVKANRAARREQYADYERRRFVQPERKRQAIEAQRRRRARHPEKNSARQAVGRAVRSGRIVRGPCEVCGTTVGIQAHHDDYSKPLDVRWLCFKHHREDAHGQTVIDRLNVALALRDSEPVR